MPVFSADICLAFSFISRAISLIWLAQKSTHIEVPRPYTTILVRIDMKSKRFHLNLRTYDIPLIFSIDFISMVVVVLNPGVNYVNVSAFIISNRLNRK